MNTATFDGEDILGLPLVIRTVQHESSPDRQINTVQLSREDGGIIVSDRYQEKRIILSGVLTEETSGDLEAQIDWMKELFSRPYKELIVSWNGSTRVYMASCVRHKFTRDHYHISHVPFTAEFLVPSGEGKDEATTLALDEEELNITTPVATSFTIGGSKSPKTTITLEGDNWPSGIGGIKITNDDTGESFVVTHDIDWGDDSILAVDCEDKSIIHEVSSVEYPLEIKGLFPKFKIGTNNITVQAGGLVAVETREGDTVSEFPINLEWQGGTPGTGEIIIAQPFYVNASDDTFIGITVALKKYGNPGAGIILAIEADNGGVPSGSVIGSATISGGTISTDMEYHTVEFGTGNVSLVANTKYWITMACVSGTVITNFYVVRKTLVASEEAGGSILVSSNGGSSWSSPGSYNGNICFKVLYGGVAGASACNATVAYRKTYL